MLLASLFYLLQPAYAETKYIITIYYEYEPDLSINFEGYSKDTDELIAASESKKDADLKFKDYIDRNNITIIDSSAEKPIVSFSVYEYEKITTIYQVYHIYHYDIAEIICTITPNHPPNFVRKPKNLPVTFCKSESDSRILSIRGGHVFNKYRYGITVSVKKFEGKYSNGRYIITDLYDHRLVNQKKVEAEVYGVIK